MSTSGPAPQQPEVGLRQRKKSMTRQALIDTAETMFAERGFDAVTVAEIAAVNNVAAKTVFVYFPAKEDLVFHDENSIRDALVSCIRDRPNGQTPLDAVRDWLASTMATSRKGPENDLDHLLRIVGDSAVLRGRMRLMWEHFETAVAEQLAEETGANPNEARPRVAAAQLVLVFRLMAAPALLEYVRSLPKTAQRKAFLNWFEDAVDSVGSGIGEYARRQ